MSQYDNVTPNTGPYAAVYQRMAKALEEGAKKYTQLLERVAATVIRDRLVSPRAMTFVADLGPPRRLLLDYGNGLALHTIHPHALTALSQKAEVPVGYTNHLVHASSSKSSGWRLTLAAHILNESFRNIDFGTTEAESTNERFLHRIVGDELRGFLSRRFNRHLASAPLLRAFTNACNEVGAVPLDARVTDIKFSLKCYLPHVFEPVPGEFVAVGVEWTNSDFGAGGMQVSLAIYMDRGRRFAVLDKALRRIHIGSVLHDSDLEISERTAKKEADAQSSAVLDAVRSLLEPAYVRRVLGAIEDAHQEQIPWDRLKGQFGKLLTKREMEEVDKMRQGGVEDLPPIMWVNADGPSPTRWWAASVLSRLADKEQNPERATELEKASGAFLKMTEE